MAYELISRGSLMASRVRKSRLAADEADGSPELRDRLELMRRVLKAVTGKWKGEILCLLLDGPRRFNELRRGIPGITQHMLAAQLRELESVGLVVRHAYDEMPPRVEYRMSESGRAFAPVAEALLAWGATHLDRTTL